MTSFADRCAAEIVDFHAALEEWFAGEGPATPNRLDGVLAPSFVLIGPSGQESPRDTVVGFLAGARGSGPVRISVKNVRPSAIIGDVAVMIYEERQTRNHDTTIRVSTAVMQDVAGVGPHDVAWIQVHETWRPTEISLSAGEPQGPA